MAEKLVDVEEAFQLWRFRHMKTVERTIGHKTGTGGSSGVGFLKRALDHAVLPRADRRAHGHRREMSEAMHAAVAHRAAVRRGAGSGAADRRHSCASASRRSFRACWPRSATASTSPIIRSAGRSTRRRTTCARGSPRGTRGWATRGTTGTREMAAFRARARRACRSAACRLHRAEDERGAGAARGAQFVRPRAARRRHARRVRFARRDPARVRAARPHRRSRSSSRCRRAVRGGGRAARRSARGADLVVVSQVMFQTGQVLPELPAIVAAAHAAGARVLLDVYHSLGVFPVDLAALDVDFAVGGSYKYLRGGPGACFLYVASASSRRRDRARSTSAGSRRSRRSPTRVRIRRATPTGGDALARIDARGAAALPGARRTAASRRRSAWRACAPIRCELQRRLVVAARRARHRGAAAAPRIAARSSWCATATRARGRTRSRRAASSPTRAANGCACAPTC